MFSCYCPRNLENSESHSWGNLASQGGKIEDTDEWLCELLEEIYRIDSGHVHVC